MKHSFKHDLSRDQTRRAADRAWESYAERLGRYLPKVTWVEDYLAVVEFKALGIHLGGELEIKQGSIDISLDVPFVLRIFKKEAIEVIGREIRFWIAKERET